MTDPKEKGAPVVPTRTPKKKTSGIFDNLRQVPQPHPVEEMLGLVSQVDSKRTTGSSPSTPSRTTSPSTPSSGATPSSHSAERPRRSPRPAPERDYMKVANSITRLAVPSGLFGEQGGKSKQLYDYLYSQTRGAVIPRRKIRIPKERLMKGADIGSEVTLRSNLKRLRAAGLIEETVVPGMHGGNEYEVFLPEEVGLSENTPSTPSSATTNSSSPQNREGVETLGSRDSSTTLTTDDVTTSDAPKTFIKTFGQNSDDDAFGAMARALAESAEDVTGRWPLSSERGRWGELGELLATELKIAAARTGSVSSVPAFLTEHLRRRLWKLDRPQTQQGREATDEGGDSTRQFSVEQIKDCPDCGGTGYWYPEGYERGVARCRHEKLTPSA